MTIWVLWPLTTESSTTSILTGCRSSLGIYGRTLAMTLIGTSDFKLYSYGSFFWLIFTLSYRSLSSAILSPDTVIDVGFGFVDAAFFIKPLVYWFGAFLVIDYIFVAWGFKPFEISLRSGESSDYSPFVFLLRLMIALILFCGYRVVRSTEESE